jgi:hypothetical protein
MLVAGPRMTTITALPIGYRIFEPRGFSGLSEGAWAMRLRAARLSAVRFSHLDGHVEATSRGARLAARPSLSERWATPRIGCSSIGSPASRARNGPAFYVPRTKMGRPAHDNSGRNPESADTAKNWNRALGRSRKLRRFRERAPGSVLRG